MINAIKNNRVIVILYAIILIVPLVFFPVLHSMIKTWIANETFTHGFLVFPITLWIIWQKKNLLTLLTPRPESKGIILLAALLLGWLIGYIVDVQVVQQLAIIAISNTLVWIILGRQIYKLLLFPLVFLFFAVPLGDQLIPVMMDFTASFTVSMLQMTGIPVYRDGLYFSLPTGNWSVIEACSGVRYLIASVALGVIYAYYNYRSVKKRLIFIAISFIVPVIANGIRAYGIVMIGHLSSMELATGADHILYGWVFFGIVIFLLFFIGSKWSDPELDVKEEFQHLRESERNDEQNNTGVLFPSTLSAVLILATLAYANHVKPADINAAQHQVELKLQENYEEWQQQAQRDLGWTPTIVNADGLTTSYYEFGSDIVQLTIGFYRNQRQGAEAVTSNNRIASDYRGKWKQTTQTELQEKNIYVRETSLRDGDRRLLVWSWYRIGPYQTPNEYIAKAINAYNVIFNGRTDASLVSIATTLEDDNKEHSREVLRSFLNVAAKPMDTYLNQLAQP